jgi:sentrin-specific protease 1
MKVERALGPGDPAEILVHHKGSNIEMTRRLMACLQGTAWLNDEVINIYAGLLQVLPSSVSY